MRNWIIRLLGGVPAADAHRWAERAYRRGQIDGQRKAEANAMRFVRRLGQ